MLGGFSSVGAAASTAALDVADVESAGADGAGGEVVAAEELAGAGAATLLALAPLLLLTLLLLLLVAAAGGGLAGSILSKLGTEFSFASRTASNISTSVILFDRVEILSSMTSVKLLKKVVVLAIKLFIKISDFD